LYDSSLFAVYAHLRYFSFVPLSQESRRIFLEKREGEGQGLKTKSVTVRLAEEAVNANLRKRYTQEAWEKEEAKAHTFTPNIGEETQRLVEESPFFQVQPVQWDERRYRLTHINMDRFGAFDGHISPLDDF
jgi:hypothetical protein